MKFLKNWIVDLVLSIILITFGVLLLIPSISTKLVSLLVSILLICFYILIIVPKYSKIKSLNPETTTWIIIESIVVISLAMLSLVGGNSSVDLVLFSLNLSDIIGLLLILEGIIGIIRYTNSDVKKIFFKYLYISLIIMGTYIFSTLNINLNNISIIVSIACFLLSIFTIIYMIKFLPKKQ